MAREIFHFVQRPPRQKLFPAFHAVSAPAATRAITAKIALSADTALAVADDAVDSSAQILNGTISEADLAPGVVARLPSLLIVPEGAPCPTGFSRTGDILVNDYDTNELGRLIAVFLPLCSR